MITYYPDDELALGPHFFMVKAYVDIVISEGGEVARIYDTSPDFFEWTIVPWNYDSSFSKRWE